MAVLGMKRRNKLPARVFAGPHRSFPIPDKNHARAALALLHHAAPADQPRIRARAKKMLES